MRGTLAYVLLGVLLLSFLGVEAQTIRGVPTPYPTIPAAIGACNPGDIVEVDPGIYTGPFLVAKPITLRSRLGAAVTTLQMQFNGSVLTFTSASQASTLQGFTIWQGSGTMVNNAPVGGGVLVSGASPTIQHCIFKRNIALGGGGAIYVHGANAAPIIRSNLFVANTSSKGGAIYFDRTNVSGSIENNVFRNNLALQMGGAICCDWASPTIAGNLIVANSSGKWGGGVILWDGPPSPMINNTIVKNMALIEGGGLFVNGNGTSVGPAITNTIFWDNHASVGPEIHQRFSTAQVTRSDVKGGWTGAGNLNVNPAFVDPARYVFHLLPSSPCIAKGGQATGMPQADCDGQPRPTTGPVCIGADEYVNGTVTHLEHALAGGPIEFYVIGTTGLSFMLIPGTLLVNPVTIPGILGQLQITAPFCGLATGVIPAAGAAQVTMALSPSPPRGTTLGGQAVLGGTSWFFSNSDSVTIF